MSPSMAAQTLLHNSASKRKQVLNNTVEFCMQVLTGQKGVVAPRQKDGILHILGALSSVLLKVGGVLLPRMSSPFITILVTHTETPNTLVVR